MKINIKNFPNEIYILLNKELYNKIIKELCRHKLKELNNKIGVSSTTIIDWKKRHQFISLKNLRKIKTILKILEIDIEKNIIEYKTKRGKFGVKNPKIPIKDSQELREIVIHMMCDGCFSSSGYAAYYNIDNETKKEFIKELEKVFGKIEYKIYKDHVHFSSAVMWILKEFFDVDFNSKKCKVPKKFFKGNRKKLIGIVRAIIIDEGTVDGSNIRLDSCNQKFLEDIKVICQRLGYSCGKTWESKGPIFRFNILAKSIEKLKKDMKKLPIHKKQTLIEMAEKNQKRGWKYRLPGKIKKEIVKLLSDCPKKNIELILTLNLPKTTIGAHLRWLIKKDILKYTIKNNIRTYSIKNKNKAYNFIKNPSEFIKSEKMDNYGLSQLKVLKMLHQKIKRYSEIEENLGFSSKSSTFKLIKSLEKKDFIKKIEKKGWIITKKGKKILMLDEKDARYLLYANIKKV